MSPNARLASLAALAALLGACSGNAVVGGQASDAGVDQTLVDAGDVVDATLDTPPDATLDAPSDGTPDVAPDAVPDLPVDEGPDVVDAPFRCADDAACIGHPGGPVCEVATGRCVVCLPSRDVCPAAQHCDAASNTCVAGCRSDEGCAPAGDAGAARGRCDTASHACVECVSNDHCAAGTLCVGSVCVPGCTAGSPCPTGQTCCGSACVDTQRNTAHCGMCNSGCSVPNASPTCMNGTCAVAMCTAPFADCDGVTSNGCEAQTLTDVAHCGGCGMRCAARPHSAASCAAGRCAYACEPGFADCDGDASNGCEVDTRTSTASCGACDRACAPPRATGVCVAGSCGVGACATGFGDCDMSASNGCEVDLAATTAHCGACGRACASRPNGLPGCVAGACVLACLAGFSDCDGDIVTGCEVDTRTSAAHCGGCGRACAPPHATGACAAGVCAVASCEAGWGDCDGAAANGCEVDLGASVAHCGRCGNACPGGGTGASSCVAGRCATGAVLATDRNLSTDSLTPGRTCAESPAYSVLSLAASTVTLQTEVPAGCLAPGDLVMLMNQQGAPGATVNVGNYEVLTVASVTGPAVTLRAPKTRFYGSGAADDANIGGGVGQQRVVLQRVPVFGELTVSAGTALTVNPWDGQRGGVMALRASRVTVEGAINLVARGFHNGGYSVDDGSCSESLATPRGESIEGPPLVTLSASAGASGGLGAASGISFNGETPLQPSAGHAAAGEPGQYPNGRTLGDPGAAYGVGDGTRVTLGSGAGGNVTCRGGSFAPFLDVAGTYAGGAVVIWSDALAVGAAGRIDASGLDGTRTAPSGGYVLLRGGTLSLGAARVLARGGAGVAENRSGQRTNRGGDGYVVVQYRDALTGVSTPAARATRVADPLAGL
ncbi:MAG: hypothetical protein U0326_15745 [Polyangiales bacterium]